MRTRAPRIPLAFAGALVASALVSTASANSQGANGYTGRPNTGAPQGESCSKAGCHSGGQAPQVSLMGPATLAAGQTADFSLVVTTAAPRAGAGIAATRGVQLTAGAGLAATFDELVQNNPQAVNGGQATFSFKVTAPLSGTTLRIWAAGLAAGGGTDNGGDAASLTTKDVAITGGAPSTDPDLDPGTSSGNPPTGGTSSGSTETPGDTDDEAADEGQGTSSGSRRLRTSSTPTASACALSPSKTGSWPLLGVSALLALALVARRRLPLEVEDHGS